jgi:hypothetical protein
MKKTQKTRRQSLLVVTVAAVVGCVLAFLGGRWIAGGRIEYWTGPTERHHFLATPDSSPVIYWILVVVFCVGAAALWAKSIADLIGWMRSRSDGGTHVA